MAATTEFWKEFNRMLLFLTLRASAFQAVTNPAWFASLRQGARDFRISMIDDDNVMVGDVTEDQVAGPAAFSSATLEGIDVSRSLFRGTAQTRMLEAFEARAGAAMVRDVQRILSQRMALHLDSKAAAELTTATYGAAAGNGLDLGKVGGTGANGIGVSRTYGGIVGRGTSDTSAAEEQFVNDVADLALRMQEYWQDQNLRGVVVGDGAPVRFAMFTLPGVSAAIKRSQFAHAGGYRSAGDIGAELMTTLRLMGGMGAFDGMLHDTAIYTVSPFDRAGVAGPLVKPAAADQNWPVYFVPVGSAVAMDSHIWLSRRIAGPLEDGSAVDRWLSVGRYAVHTLKQEHLGRASVNASA